MEVKFGGWFDGISVVCLDVKNYLNIFEKVN